MTHISHQHTKGLKVKLIYISTNKLHFFRTCGSVLLEGRASAPGWGGWWSGKWKSTSSWWIWRRWFTAVTGRLFTSDESFHPCRLCNTLCPRSVSHGRTPTCTGRWSLFWTVQWSTPSTESSGFFLLLRNLFQTPVRWRVVPPRSVVSWRTCQTSDFININLWSWRQAALRPHRLIPTWTGKRWGLSPSSPTSPTGLCFSMRKVKQHNPQCRKPWRLIKPCQFWRVLTRTKSSLLN